MKDSLRPKQINCIETLDRDMIVNAGAGTGKTRVLTNRYLNIINKKKADVEQILCITFTEKAAAEIKERIINILRREKKYSNNSYKDLNDIIEKLEFAYISTIHSFCSRMLREYCVEIGIDPEFTIIDQLESEILKEEVFSNVLERINLERKTDLDYFTKYANWTTGGINTLVKSLVKIYDKIRLNNHEYLEENNYEGFTGKSFFEKKFNDLKIEIDNIIEELSYYTFESNKFEDFHTNLKSLFKEIKNSSNEDFSQKNIKLFEKMSSSINLKKIGVKRKSISYEDTSNMLKNLREVKIPDLANLYIDIKLFPIKSFLFDLIKHFHQEYSQKKIEESIIDYDDLLEKFYLILKKNERIRKRVKDRFKYILIDEYQDTNYLQKSIINLIKRENNLFVVGDVKQSIYAFRNADYRVFLDQEDEIKKSGGSLITLDENFRSRKEIIDFVNFIFEKNWDELFDFKYQKLICAQDFSKKSDLPSIEILYSKGKSAEDARKIEASLITRRIKQIVENKKVCITNKNLKDYGRNLSYKDFLVLLKSTSDIKIYERAFAEKGIPFFTFSGRGFFNAREIIDIENFLKILENPYEEILLASVLKSPLFFVKDETLFQLSIFSLSNKMEIIEAVKFIEREEIGLDEKEKLNKFLIIYNKALKILRIKGLGSVVSYLYKSTNILVKILSEYDGKRKYMNLLKLEDLAYQYSEKLGIRDFLKIIKESRIREIRKGEASTVAEKDDVVKIMTIHSAKGLESPVVILPDISRKNRITYEDFIFDDEYGIGFKVNIYDIDSKFNKSFSYSKIKEKLKIKEQGENTRLLYVALTRAKEHLIISGAFSTKKGGDWNKSLIDSLDLKNFEDYEEKHFIIKDINLPLNIFYSENISKENSIKYDSINKKYKNTIKNLEKIDIILSENLKTQTTKIIDEINLKKQEKDFSNYIYSISEIMNFSFCKKYYYLNDVLGIRETNEKDYRLDEINTQDDGINSKSFGTTVHKVFELIDFKNPNFGIENLILSVLNDMKMELNDRLVKDLSDYIINFTNLNIFEDIKESDFIKREESIIFRYKEVNLSCKIDLLYEDNGGKLNILDYKSNKVDKIDIEHLLKHYYLQMWFYREGVKQTFDEYPENIFIYFVRNNQLKKLDFRKENTYIDLLQDFIEFNKNYRIESIQKEKCEECKYVKFCF